MKKPLVLICDDDESFLDTLYKELKNKYDLHKASTVIQAKSLFQKFEYDAAVIDLHYEGQELDGVHLLSHASKCSPGTFLIVLSGDRETKRVVEATRHRLFDFIPKNGSDTGVISTVLENALRTKVALSKSITENYLTDSPDVKSLLEQALKIIRANRDATILILGESGTGKEVLVRHIAHLASKALVAINMASIPKEMADSILFGHEKGSFTGSTVNKIGLFESANKGIFFLDEIGEATLSVQAKLLRVLQEKEVRAVGSNQTRTLDVQFIAATNQDLSKMVADGNFRLDLLQRLNTFVLRLPPLRERPKDILLYAQLHLQQGPEQNLAYKLTDGAISALLNHPWPGNIRELKNVMDRIIIFAEKSSIEGSDVVSAINMGGNPAKVLNNSQITQREDTTRRDNLVRVLREVNGNKRAAAKTLGISEATLYRWISDFGLSELVNKKSLFIESLKNAVGVS